MSGKWDEETIQGLASKLDVKDAAGMLPLHHAIKQKAPLEAMQLLINGCSDALSVKDMDGKLPLHYAAEKNLPIDYHKLLLAGYPRGLREKDDNGLLPLHHLLRFCTDLELVKLFVSSYGDSTREKDKDGWLPLHFAARDNSSPEVIQYLIVKYAGGLCEKTRHGSLPIHCAAHFNGNASVMQFLADQFPASLSTPGTKGMWPVHCAARNNPSLDILRLLIKLLPTSVSAEDSDQHLPLHHSIRNISIGVMKYLIALYPAALRMKDANGWLPVHTAARYSVNLEVISCLTSHYPEGLQALDVEDWLPLHHAARSNLSLDVVKFLVRAYPEALLHKAGSVDKFVYQLAPDDSDKKVFLSLLYTALNRESVQSLGVVRLHLIGDGFAGKTVCSKWIQSLISLSALNWQSIDLFDSPLDVPLTERTRGMETTHLAHSKTLTDHALTHYLIHDYAGQQEYLINHANFLNIADSCYILVLPVFDKSRKQRVPADRLVERALFWLKFLYSSTHKLYSSGGRRGIPVCIVLNTFASDVTVPVEELHALRRRIMSEARRTYSFQTFSDHVAEMEVKAKAGREAADFVLVGDELLLVDARMKFSVKLLIDALKSVSNSLIISNTLSRESKLQAYCWEILNLLNLSVVMREEDLLFIVTSTIRAFFNKQLHAYILVQQAKPDQPPLTEEELALRELLKEMRSRAHIVTQVEELLADYIMEVLQALGKILVIKQQKYIHHHHEDDEDEDCDKIVITSPHDLSHTILGHLYGNLRSFAGKDHGPRDLILRPQQIALLLTYLPTLPITVPRLLVLLGVCIPVHYLRGDKEVVRSVFDAPEYNQAYSNPAPVHSASAGYESSPYVNAYNQHSAGGANSSNMKPPPLPSTPPPPPPADEKCYWAIGLVQKAVAEETDFSALRLRAEVQHALTRVFLISNENKFMLIPGFFARLFVFLYSLQPDSLSLAVYRDGFNLTAEEVLPFDEKEVEKEVEEVEKEEVQDSTTEEVHDLPPPPPVPAATTEVENEEVPAPSTPEEVPQRERKALRQLLVLPFANGNGFQLTVATDIDRSPASGTSNGTGPGSGTYCLSTMLRVRQFLQQEMWGIELQECCLPGHTFADTPEEVPSENRFYRSNLYDHIYANANHSTDSSSSAEGSAPCEVLRVQDAEDRWFQTQTQTLGLGLVREQLFGYTSSEVQQEEEDEDALVVPLSCGGRVRALPLLPPYSTYSSAVEDAARCLLLADAAGLQDAHLQQLLLQRMRDIGITSSTSSSTPLSLGLSRQQLRELAAQARERFLSLCQGSEMDNLAARDPSDLPLLPVLTAMHRLGGDDCEQAPRMHDYRLHFLCPVCGQRARSGRDGEGYALQLLGQHTSEEVLQALSYSLSACETLVQMAAAKRISANGGALLALGSVLQDTMDMVRKQMDINKEDKDKDKGSSLQMSAQRLHRLQNHLFLLMKDLLQHLQHQPQQQQQHATVLGVLGARGRGPLLGDEDAHLLPELRADARYLQGMLRLLLAADDQHLLHTGLIRVVHSSGAIAWVCGPQPSEDTDTPSGVQDALSVLTQGISKLTAGTSSTDPPHTHSSHKHSHSRHSGCQEEFLRSGRDCVVLKLKYP